MINENKNDFILRQIQMLIKALKAFLGSLLGKSEEQQKEILDQLEESGKLDDILKDITGLNDTLLKTSPDFLIHLLKGMGDLDENKKAMICLIFYVKKEERYKEVSHALLATLNTKKVNKDLIKLLFDILGKENLDKLKLS